MRDDVRAPLARPEPPHPYRRRPADLPAAPPDQTAGRAYRANERKASRACPRSTVRRSIAAVAALPLLALAATACGYGSEAKDDDAKKANVSAGEKKLSTDTVKIGYFPNLTHATALVGIQEGTIQKELGGTQVESTTFNAGPSEIEALNAGSIDIGFIGPSPPSTASASPRARDCGSSPVWPPAG